MYWYVLQTEKVNHAKCMERSFKGMQDKKREREISPLHLKRCTREIFPQKRLNMPQKTSE